MQLNNIASLYEIFKQYPSVQTDTRNLKKGDLFFALKGPSFNGNTFALQALAMGAAFAIIDEAIEANIDQQKQLILVEDVLTTLQALAKYHRENFNIPFIAITGSNGKTTTKELVTAVLASHFKTYTTKGNLNNHIGVPLTILSIPTSAQMAVIEMGANHLHEIASYCSYTLPTHGLITNCGKAHLEGFGSLEGVKKAKGELFDFLRATNGTAFIMKDYDYLQTLSKGIQHIITYGTHSAELIGKAKEGNAFLEVVIEKENSITIQTKLVGNYNLPNVLAAVAIGTHFNVPMAKIKDAIESYQPTNSRSQLLVWQQNNVILDAYNANPSSMKLAIENFAKLTAQNKVLCIGGMKELGADSIMEHQIIIDLINQFTWHKVLLVGGDFRHCSHNYTFIPSSEEARDWMQKEAFTHCTILIKGSRGIQMEKIIA